MPSFSPFPIIPAQSVEGVATGCNSLLIPVGAALYYVTSAQVGVAEGTFNLWIMKSIDGGHTWVQKYNGPKASVNFAILLIGSVIHVFGDNHTGGVQPINVFRYDTTIDAFLADGVQGPDFAASRGIAVAPFSDGTILSSYNTGLNLDVAVYDPVADTWGAAQTAVAVSPTGPIVQIIDPANDIGFVFYTDFVQLLCFPVSKPTTIGLTVTAATTTGVNFFNFDFAVGVPSIVGGQVVVPFMDPSDGSGQGVLFALRSPSSIALNFSIETVDNTVLAPAAFWVLERLAFGWQSIVIGGLLYLFYSVNVNALDDSASQTAIFYRTSAVPGVWSDPTLVWTGPVPSSSLAFNVAHLGAGEIGIVEPYVDPVQFFGQGTKYQSLSNVFLGPPVLPSVRLTLRGIKRRPCSSEPPAQEYTARPPETHVRRTH